MPETKERRRGQRMKLATQYGAVNNGDGDHQAPDVRLLSLETIRPSFANPRQTFDEEKLQELAASIKTHGVLQPIVVRPVKGAGYTETIAPVNDARQLYQLIPWPAGSHDGPEYKVTGKKEALALVEFLKYDHYEIVAGERRYRACLLLQRAQIPAHVRELTNQEAAEIRAIENLQREDLDACEEAQGFQDLIRDHGYTAESLADKLGKATTYVYGALKLVNLPAIAREAVASGKISKNHGILIGRIPSAKLRQKAADEILQPTSWTYEYRDEFKGEALTFRQAKEMIEEKFMVELKGAPFDRKSLTLVAEAGSCDDCPKRTGNNRVEYPEGRADVCTDPECFRGKVRAHEAQARARAKDKGAPMLPAKEAKKCFSRWSWEGKNKVQSGSGYVDLGVQVPADKKKRSYKELVGEELKAETYSVLDPSGRIHYVVKRQSANAVLCKDKGINQGEEERSAGMHRFNGDQERTRKKTEALRDAFADQVFGRIRQDMTHVAGLSAEPIMKLLVNAVRGAHECGGYSETWLDAPARAFGVALQESDYEDAVKSLDRVLAGRNGTELAALLVYIGCRTWNEYFFGLTERPVRELAELLSIDMAAVKAAAKEALKPKKPANREDEPVNGTSKPAGEFIADLGLDVKAIKLASIVSLLASHSGSDVKSVRPFEIAGRRYVTAGGRYQFDRCVYECRPLYGLHEFGVTFPDRQVRPRPHYPDPSKDGEERDGYFGTQLKVKGVPHVIGPRSETRILRNYAEEPSCRTCGCTESHACPGGCSWVEPDLCSACQEKGEGKAKRRKKTAAAR